MFSSGNTQWKKLLKSSSPIWIFDGSGFSNSLWLPRYLKNLQNKTTKSFLVSNTKIKILTNQG